MGPVVPLFSAKGLVSTASPLSEVTEPVTVSLNGVACRTLFAGLAPGFAGLYQINFEVPADFAAGGELSNPAAAGRLA